MNILLRIILNEINRHGITQIATAEIICKASNAFDIFDRFFSCFDQSEKTTVYPWSFATKCEIAPIWEMTENSKLAEKLDENDPFGIGDYMMNTIWHDLNEWKYNPKKLAEMRGER